MLKIGVDELMGVLARRDELRDLFLGQVGAVSKMEKRQGEYKHQGRSGEDDVLWML